VLYQICG
jgi:serine/threonine protein kinase